MTEDKKSYSQGYHYKLVYDFDYSEVELRQQQKLLGEMRLSTELMNFLKKEFFSKMSNVEYELYKINVGLIIFTDNETIMQDLSNFCDSLKKTNILFDMSLKLSGSASEHNIGQINNILEKCYTNYILNKDLDVNLKTAIKKLKV